MKQRSTEALLPIHVIVPNHVLATLLERALFSDSAYIAVHVEMPHEFAWRIARDRALVEGFLPTPEDVDVAIVLSAAAGSVSAKDARLPEERGRNVWLRASGASYTASPVCSWRRSRGASKRWRRRCRIPRRLDFWRASRGVFRSIEEGGTARSRVRCIAVRWKRCRSKLLASSSSEMSQSQRHSKRSQPGRPARNRSRGWGGAGHAEMAPRLEAAAKRVRSRIGRDV